MFVPAEDIIAPQDMPDSCRHGGEAPALPHDVSRLHARALSSTVQVRTAPTQLLMHHAGAAQRARGREITFLHDM